MPRRAAVSRAPASFCAAPPSREPFTHTPQQCPKSPHLSVESPSTWKPLLPENLTLFFFFFAFPWAVAVPQRREHLRRSFYAAPSLREPFPLSLPKNPHLLEGLHLRRSLHPDRPLLFFFFFFPGQLRCRARRKQETLGAPRARVFAPATTFSTYHSIQ